VHHLKVNISFAALEWLAKLLGSHT